MKWQKKEAPALTFGLKGEPMSLLSLYTEPYRGAHRNIPSYQGPSGDMRKCVFVAETPLSSRSLFAFPPGLIATFTSSFCPSPSGSPIMGRGWWPLPGLAHDCFPCDPSPFLSSACRMSLPRVTWKLCIKRGVSPWPELLNDRVPPHPGQDHLHCTVN